MITNLRLFRLFNFLKSLSDLPRFSNFLRILKTECEKITPCKSSSLRWVLDILLIVFFTSLLSSCSLWWQPESSYEHEISSNRGYYLIEPNTILKDLDSPSIDIFRQTSAEPTWTYSLGKQTIAWNQDDYFRIIYAFHEFIWQESLNTWKLHSISFRIACRDIEQGYLYGDFEYYKIVNVNGKENRLIRSMHVRPGDKSIDWWQRQLFPVIEQWEEIDTSILKVTVDNALLLAEKNGGRSTRLEIANDCDISLLLNPDAFYDGWQVGYSDKNANNIFKIYIDPFTGEYKIVNN